MDYFSKTCKPIQTIKGGGWVLGSQNVNVNKSFLKASLGKDAFGTSRSFEFCMEALINNSVTSRPWSGFEYRVLEQNS